MKTTNHKKFVNPNPIQRALIGNFQRRFLTVLGSVQPQSVLEMGCGEGFLLTSIKKQFPNIPLLGQDNLDVALAAGKEIFPDLDLQHGDIYHINQPDHSWDVVIASEVLEHLDHPDAAIKEMKRVAKRYLLLSVPHEPLFRGSNLLRGRHLTRLGNHPEHINLWTRASFGKFVGQFAHVERLTGSFPWTILLARV
jgi:2-polyprenyl-3-methyl-5-hydroxy-6-metoxy-1,4-benzoquinol methylase